MKIEFNNLVKVFKDDNGKYKIAVSRKNQNGTYDKAYFQIEFNKGDLIDNGAMIKINNAWLSFYNWKYQDKKGTTFFIKTNDYEVQKAELVVDENVETDPYEDFGNKVSQEELELTDEDLPF